MIKTNEIKLSEKSYLKILLVKYFKQKWWLFAWMTALSFLILYMDKVDTFSYFIVFFPLIFTLYIFFYFRRFVYAKENRIFLIGRYYEIDNDLMVGFVEDGTQSQIKLEHFIKMYKAKNFILLYLSQISMIYLPKDAFASQDEYDEVIKIIEHKIVSVGEKP